MQPEVISATAFMPAIVWEQPLQDVGEDEDPGAKLLGQLTIGGVPHHIEGWAVRENEETGEQEAVSEYTSYEEVTNSMTEGAGVTVEINGREYFMVVTPHQL